MKRRKPARKRSSGAKPAGDQARKEGADIGRLLLRIHAGDQDACTEFVQLYQPSMGRFIHRFLAVPPRPLESTGDLVMSVLHRFLERVKSGQFIYEGPAQLWTYLQICARSEVVTSKRRKRPPALGSQGLRDLDDDGPGIVLVESARDPVIGRRLQMFEAAVASRPKKARDAIVMHYVQRWTYERIAHELKMPSAEAARKFTKREFTKVAEFLRNNARNK